MTVFLFWVGIVFAQEENTLEKGFLIQGEVQRPDLNILMAKDDVTESYELKLTESFLPKILKSLEDAPL